MALTADEINVLRRTLPYELEMLRFAYRVATSDDDTLCPDIAPDAADKDTPVIADAPRMLFRLMAIDMFYVRARSLIEFYKDKLGGVGSRTASAAVFTKPGVKYPAFKDIPDLINDQVAHINFARDEHAKPVLSGDMMTAIKRQLDICLDLFQKNLTDEADKIWKHRDGDFYIGSNSAAAATNHIYTALSKIENLDILLDEKFLRYNVDIGETND